MSNANVYETKDFYNSVILRATGFKLLRLARSSSDYVTFVFSDPEINAEMTITDHWNRNLKVNSRDLIEAINELKTRLYSKK